VLGIELMPYSCCKMTWQPNPALSNEVKLQLFTVIHSSLKGRLIEVANPCIAAIWARTSSTRTTFGKKLASSGASFSSGMSK